MVRLIKTVSALLIVALFFVVLFKIDDGRLNGVIDGADSFLEDAGMSADEISELDSTQKTYILDKIGNTEAKYLKHSKIDFDALGEKLEEGAEPYISISFTSFKLNDTYCIFPSFSKYGKESIKNDTFKTEMYLGWYSSEMSEDMVLYTKNSSGGIKKKTNLKQAGILEYGSIFIMNEEDDTAYSGYGYFEAIKLSDSSEAALSYIYSGKGISFVGSATIE